MNSLHAICEVGKWKAAVHEDICSLTDSEHLNIIQININTALKFVFGPTQMLLNQKADFSFVNLETGSGWGWHF